MAADDLQQLGRQLGVEEAAGGQVDRDLELEALPAPAREIAHRLLHDVSRQRRDQRRLLDHRHELGRREQAPLGVLPADQRLDARHPARLQVELRLVVHHELAPLERRSDLAEQAQAVGVEMVALRRVFLHAAAGDAGAPERGLGVLDQLQGAARRGVHGRDADADLDVDADPVEHHRGLEHTLNLARHARRTTAGQRAGEQRELVVADSGEERDMLEVVLQPVCHRAQQLVAGLVSERVVDLLEAFDIGDQDGAFSSPAPSAARRPGARCTGSCSPVP